MGCKPGDRFCFLVEPGVQFLVCLWAGWLRGLIAVPLCVKHPPEEIEYVLSNSEPKAVFGCDTSSDKLIQANRSLQIKTVTYSQDTKNSQSYYNWLEHDPALMIYTSGTTGRPKGAVHTAGSLSAQVSYIQSPN